MLVGKAVAAELVEEVLEQLILVVGVVVEHIIALMVLRAVRVLS